MTVRNLEVRLTELEDDISQNLGYREYIVKVGSTTLDPRPYCDMKKVEDFKPGTLDLFKQNLQGNTTPIGFFSLNISRTIPENIIRTYDYWYIIRDGIESQCLPVSIQVEDARYKVMLAIVKKNKYNYDFDSVTLNNTTLNPNDTLSVNVSVNNYPNSVIQITWKGEIRIEDVEGKLPSQVVTDGDSNASFSIQLKSDVDPKSFYFILKMLEIDYESEKVEVV
jgi:hypothetical protein